MTLIDSLPGYTGAIPAERPPRMDGVAPAGLVPEWTFDRFSLVLIGHIATFLVLASMLKLSMFSGGSNDGFFQGIQYTHRTMFAGDEEGALKFVHIVRYLVVYPFFLAWSHDMPPVVEAGLLTMFMLPFLLARFGKRRPYIQAAFVYLPLVISFRSVLVVSSIAYLFVLLYSSRRSYLLLAMSALLANLSSGVVLGWCLVVAFNLGYFLRNYRHVALIMAFLAVGFGISILNKISFFTSTGTRSLWLEPILRSTIIDVACHGQFVRLCFYVMLALLAFGAFVGALLERRRLGFVAFYLVCLATMFFEGLGAMAFIVPIAWFYLGVRPIMEAPAGVAAPAIRNALAAGLDWLRWIGLSARRRFMSPVSRSPWSSSTSEDS